MTTKINILEVSEKGRILAYTDDLEKEGIIIAEVNPQLINCYKVINGECKLDNDALIKREACKSKNTIKEELQQLKNWFKEYFDIQYIQSQWQDNYRPSFDNIMQRQYYSIEELKGQANINRKRIKELKSIIQQPIKSSWL